MTGGASLIELMVAIGVMSIIIVGAFQVMTEGLKLYRANQRAADAQLSILQALTRISNEATNAKAELVRAYPAGGPALPGVVFASPLTAMGNTDIDPDSGEIRWHKWICFYYLPGDPAAGTYGKIFRSEKPINPPEHDIDTLETELSSLTTDYFKATPALQTRLLSTDISGFEIEKYEGDEYGNTSGSAVHTAYTFTIQAGRATSTDQAKGITEEEIRPEGYFIQVESRVTPRG